LLVALTLISLTPDLTAAELTGQSRFKAAYLYNFVKYTRWPAESFADSKSPIIIGVLGKDPFGEQFDAMVKNRPIRGREVRIRRCATAAEARACHLLFVPPSEDDRLDGIMTHLTDQALLTVGESKAFLKAGGMIRFILDKSGVRFEINRAPAERVGIRLSAQLLKLASKTHRK
jgi:hypothetical protein